LIWWLIDYLRDNRTNTSVCAFSPRLGLWGRRSSLQPIAWRNANGHNNVVILDGSTMATPGESIDVSLREFLSALSSAESAHGAVSAAAVAGGLGTSLLLMVAALPKTRSDSATDRTALIAASAALNSVQEQLLETIETETVVKVYVARNMPQASAAQRTEREAAIQLALRAAADVPLEVIRLCALGLQQARTVARHCSRAAAAEVELGVTLLRAGFSGARSNLEAKLTSLTDVVYTTAIVEELARLSEEATSAASAAEASIQVPPA
jgi:formiminotetrahydrofolate cyclodeaminase